MSTKLVVVPKPAGDVAPDLRRAIELVAAKLQPEDVDGPLFALAMRYAEEIEQARAIRDEADQVMRRAYEDGKDGLVEQVRRLRRRIELAETVTKIGPLLNKALDDLLATPAARAKGGKVASPTAAGRMAQLRGAVGGGA